MRWLSRFDEQVMANTGPPRMRVEEACIDVAAGCASGLGAIQVLADACQARRTTAVRMLAALARRTRVPRRALLLAVLSDIAAGTCSVLEHRYLTHVERIHGLPRATRQRSTVTPSGTVMRDVEYAELGLYVELDGRLFHDSAVGRDADLERDLDAAVDGRETVRLGWGQVFDRPCGTAGKVARLLADRGWRGVPTPCGAGCTLS